MSLMITTSASMTPDIDLGGDREPFTQCTRFLAVTKTAAASPVEAQGTVQTTAWAVYTSHPGSRVRRDLAIEYLTGQAVDELADRDDVSTTTIRDRQAGLRDLVHIRRFEDDGTETHWVRLAPATEHGQQEIEMLLGHDYRAAALLAA